MVELARIQNVSLDDADAATRMPPPIRPTPDRAVLEGPADTKESFKAFREELRRLTVAIDNMVVSAKRIRDRAVGMVSPELGGDSIVWQNSGTLYEGGGSDGFGWGSDAGPPLLAHEYRPSEKTSQLGSWFRPVPGRKVVGSDRKAQWMFLDTWWIVGPFANPNRSRLDYKYPPETTTDLDATYIGKNDRPLKWRRIIAEKLPIVPPLTDKYAIWYAYTTIWSDEDREYWVAFGSDDHSKAWLNGESVWASGKEPQAYIPDVGYRKLHFRQGVNRMLFKLENAGGTTGFSVVLFLEPVAKQ
jgi:hypothetical protein